MKTEFQLECLQGTDILPTEARIRIIGKAPKNKVYVVIETIHGNLFMKDKHLKLFAQNLMKSLTEIK